VGRPRIPNAYADHLLKVAVDGNARFMHD